MRLREAGHPRHDRRAVNLRWLGATSLLTVASAGGLWLVLHAALLESSRLVPPERAARLSPVERPFVSGLRTDRLVRAVVASPKVREAPVRTETLQSTGLGDGPLTVLVADLAHVEGAPRDTPEPPPDIAPDPIHDHAPPPPSAALPPLITTGLAAATSLPARAASYAAVGTPVEPGPIGTPLNVTTEVRSSVAPLPDRMARIIAQRGDDLTRLLSPIGLTAQDVADLSGAFGGSPLAFKGGETLEIWRSGDHPMGRPYKIELHRLDGTTLSAALTDADRYARIDAERPEAAAATSEPSRPEAGGGDEDMGEPDSGSLRQALTALDGHAGVDQALSATIVRVLNAGLDLGHGVAAGNQLQALYTTASDGTDRSLLFAALLRQGSTTQFYRFQAPDDGSVDYYDHAGHSIMKFLLRKPVANGQLGDGFGWRIHPVLHDRRFHEGVDYRAPFGSPIVAAGAGTIEKIGWEKGYGYYIRIRHDLGYETTYAHVSSMARGMSVGRRVQQGQTIAYVGSTGYSTGPHLYYEVRINGRNVDPLSVRLAAGRFLDGATLAEFTRQRDRIDTLVKAASTLRGG